MSCSTTSAGIAWTSLSWGTPVSGTAYPPLATPAVAGASGAPGAVQVPAGSGLSVDATGVLRLSLAGLPITAPTSGFWNDNGLLAVVSD